MPGGTRLICLAVVMSADGIGHTVLSYCCMSSVEVIFPLLGLSVTASPSLQV